MVPHPPRSGAWRAERLFMRLGSRVGTQGKLGEEEGEGELIVPCVIPERLWSWPSVQSDVPKPFLQKSLWLLGLLWQVEPCCKGGGASLARKAEITWNLGLESTGRIWL